MKLTCPEFRYLQALVRDLASVILPDARRPFVEARLTALLCDLGGPSEGLITRLRAPGGAALRRRVVEAALVTETRFFRDQAPFEALREVILPRLAERREPGERLAFWSAGCSTGQELYSLAMLIDHGHRRLFDGPVELAGFDVSRSALARAEAGSYSALEIGRGLPESFRERYARREGERYVLRPELRRRLRFQELHLARPWPALGLADVILLRNVLIYFDAPTRAAVLSRVRSRLKPGGVLILGTAEAPSAVDGGFETVHRGRAVWYRRRERGVVRGGPRPLT